MYDFNEKILKNNITCYSGKSSSYGNLSIIPFEISVKTSDNPCSRAGLTSSMKNSGVELITLLAILSNVGSPLNKLSNLNFVGPIASLIRNFSNLRYSTPSLFSL